MKEKPQGMPGGIVDMLLNLRIPIRPIEDKRVVKDKRIERAREIVEGPLKPWGVRSVEIPPNVELTLAETKKPQSFVTFPINRFDY